jgi:hypothetical protein
VHADAIERALDRMDAEGLDSGARHAKAAVMALIYDHDAWPVEPMPRVTPRGGGGLCCGAPPLRALSRPPPRSALFDALKAKLDALDAEGRLQYSDKGAPSAAGVRVWMLTSVPRAGRADAQAVVTPPAAAEGTRRRGSPPRAVARGKAQGILDGSDHRWTTACIKEQLVAEV